MANEKRKFLGVPYVFIVAGFALAASLAIIVYLHSIDSTVVVNLKDGKIAFPQRSIWVVILEHVATATFILAVWQTLDYVLIRREFNVEIIEHFEALKTEVLSQTSEFKATLTRDLDAAQSQWTSRLEEAKSHFATAKHDSTFGLVSTYHEASQFGFSSMIERSHRLTAVMADGYSWFSRHTEAFIERFGDPDKQTTFIFVHPNSDLIDVVSRKIGMSPILYRERIYSTIREIRKLAGKNARVTILGHSLINCHAVYIADGEIVFSPYFLSSQRRIPPVMVLRDAGAGSFFQKLSSDISFLQKESIPIDWSIEPPGVVQVSNAKRPATD